MDVNYDQLLELSSEVGRQLLVSGAEIYRAEESIGRILESYGITTGEVFAIPNCIIVSLTTPTGHPVTRVCRIPAHGTDIFLLEKYNDLSRKLCQETPPFEEAMALLEEIQTSAQSYSPKIQLFGYFLGCAAFTLFFHGTWVDTLCGGLCGAAMGYSVYFMGNLGVNLFFKTVIGGMSSALLAIILTKLGIGENVDLITIGALMALVPGIAFTNAMRDVMAGDLVSGITKVGEALLIGGAIAVGTSIAVGLSRVVEGLL